MYENSRKYIGVETVLNIYDANRLWYYIPGWNGYELSNDGYVRSMKHFKKYPYGILITPVKNSSGNIKNPEDPTFEMSDNNNDRRKVHLSELKALAANNTHRVAGYPRATIVSDPFSRNERHFTQKKKNRVKPADNTVHSFARFTIIDE